MSRRRLQDSAMPQESAGIEETTPQHKQRVKESLEDQKAKEGFATVEVCYAYNNAKVVKKQKKANGNCVTSFIGKLDRKKKYYEDLKAFLKKEEKNGIELVGFPKDF